MDQSIVYCPWKFALSGCSRWGHLCCLYQFCIRLSYSHGTVCICCISPVSDGVIQEKPKHPKALWAFVSLVSYKFSGSMEVLYRDIGACVGAHARESNSTSDTVIQVLQCFCREGVTEMMTPYDDLTTCSVMVNDNEELSGIPSQIPTVFFCQQEYQFN